MLVAAQSIGLQPVKSLKSLSTTSGSSTNSLSAAGDSFAEEPSGSSWHEESLLDEDPSLEPVTGTYGPIRKRIPSHSTPSLHSATSSSALLSAPPPQPKTTLKLRYGHYENALVYLALATRLLEPETRPIDFNQPYCVFRTDSDDPPLKSDLSSFAERLAFGLRCKYPCYVLALMYLEQVKRRHSYRLPITRETFQRLCIAAAVVAAKFYDDLYYSNEYYARELGVKLELLNTMEMCFLVVQDFNLRVSPTHFERMMAKFDGSRQAPVWCGLQSSRLPPELVPVVAAANSALTLPSRASNFVIADARTRRLAHTHLVSRESQGCRYETEQEYLYNSEVLSQCRNVKKLLDQYQEEIYKLENRRRPPPRF